MGQTIEIIFFYFFILRIASSVALLANQSSATEMKDLKETIFNVGADTQRSIERVAKATTQMQQLLVPYDSTTASILGTTTHRLENESRSVQRFVKKK